MDKLQKLVESIVRDKVNPQEPPSIISTATSSQLQIPTVISIGIVDTTIQKPSAAVEEGIEQIGQTITSDPTAQRQGALPKITIIDQGSRQ